jgi:hypothetical protein
MSSNRRQVGRLAASTPSRFRPNRLTAPGGARSGCVASTAAAAPARRRRGGRWRRRLRRQCGRWREKRLRRPGPEAPDPNCEVPLSRLRERSTRRLRRAGEGVSRFEAAPNPGRQAHPRPARWRASRLSRRRERGLGAITPHPQTPAQQTSTRLASEGRYPAPPSPPQPLALRAVCDSHSRFAALTGEEGAGLPSQPGAWRLVAKSARFESASGGWGCRPQTPIVQRPLASLHKSANFSPAETSGIN